MKKLYGIKNCDKVRQARALLEKIGERYQYIDLRDNPPPQVVLERWFTLFGLQMINKRSTTYRENKAEIETIQNTEDFIAILQKYPTVMQRPILEADSEIFLGKTALDFLAEKS